MWSCYVRVQAPEHNAFCKPNLSPHNEICGVLTEFAMASPGLGEAKVNQGLARGSRMWSCYVWVQAPEHNAFCKPNLSPHNEICGVLTEFAMAIPGTGEAKVNQGLPQ